MLGIMATYFERGNAMSDLISLIRNLEDDSIELESIKILMADRLSSALAKLQKIEGGEVIASDIIQVMHHAGVEIEPR